MRHDSALKLAVRLVEQFRPAYKLVEIAGGVSRGKPDVHDIEIVGIPNLEPQPRPRAEFGKPMPKYHKLKIDQLVADMVDRNEIILLANGDRYKKLWHVECDVQIDLFLCIAPSEYGVFKLIRTGPEEFSQWCVTNRSKRGALPDGYFVKHNVVWVESYISRNDVPRDQDKAVSVLTDQNHLRMPVEMDFLNFLDLGWVDPHFRAAKWNRG